MTMIAILNENDNVATALTHIDKGITLNATTKQGEFKVETAEKIPLGHKVALADIPKGSPVYKYGEVIGTAVTDIKVGELVHVHNTESIRGRGDLKGEK